MGGYGLLSQTLAALREAGAVPRKRLGQHFLVDDNIARLIVETATAAGSERILEIGPGLGLLTAQLAARCHSLIAVEKDATLARLAAWRLSPHPHARVLYEDFLKADLRALLGSGTWVVVGNLPYSITSPILFRLMEQRRSFSRLVLMMQRQVAQRATAQPGGKDFSLLSILVQMFCETRLAKTVSPNCFYPAPKVESAIVELTTRRAPAAKVSDEGAFIAFCKRLFQQRRKQMLTILRGMFPNQSRESLAAALAQADVVPERRPEQLGIPVLAATYRALCEQETP